MSPDTIIREAFADGVKLDLSASGNIKATGDQMVVSRWLATIRQHKPELVETLRHTDLRSWCWLIHFTDRDPVPASFSPEVTHAEALACYPDAVAAEPYTPPPLLAVEPMAVEEEEAITGWLERIGETDPATIGEAIRQCQKDLETRRYFLDRAEETPAPDDDRRTCAQCANLTGRRCQAAKRGEIVPSRNYEPIRDIPRRCEGYRPTNGDPDQRSGTERWPDF